jgi:nitrate/nitrite transport system substrate-binding protein
MNVATIQNNNGQAITLSLKTQGPARPQAVERLRWAIPFEHSMHNYLLRYYLLKGREPRHRCSDRGGTTARDGGQAQDNSTAFGPDPFNQRGV